MVDELLAVNKKELGCRTLGLQKKIKGRETLALLSRRTRETGLKM